MLLLIGDATLSRNMAVKGSGLHTEQANATKPGMSSVQNGTVKLVIPASPVLARKSSVSMKNKPPSPKGTPLKRVRTTSINSDSSIRFGQKDKELKEKEQTKSSEIKEGKVNDLKHANLALLLYPDNGNRPADHEHHTGKFPNLHPSMHPVLFLFVAPPAAAAVAWSEMHGDVFDSLSKALFFVSLFIFFCPLFVI